MEKLCMGCMELYADTSNVCPHCGYMEGTAPKEAYHLIPGTVLDGKYIVGRAIGYGGFGVTYIGYNAVLEQKVAIKEYLPGEFATRCAGTEEVTIFTGDREEQFLSGIEKFVDEAKRLAKFKDNPGIVRIYDSFAANKTAYIIMEYLEGETLKEKLEREGKLAFEDALSIMMPIMEALKEVHKEGILHRDISPDNIFITETGEMKLLDFGAARYATTTHSRSLSVIVKPGFAPQEQYRSRGDQGTWTDVYACAATLYKMITGVTPEDSMERGIKDTLVPPSKLGVKIPKNKENAIMNAMNLRIEDRTQTVDDFERDLSTERDVKRNKIRLKKMDIGRWPMWVKIASGAVASAIVLVGVLLATGVISVGALNIFDKGELEEGNVYVPNVVNYSLPEAEKMTADAGLIVQITDKQNSDMIPKDLVMSQNIRDGVVVSAGTVLELTVSAGGEIVYMPELRGMEKQEAEQLLEDMKLYFDETEVESGIAPGYIAGHAPSEGEAIEKGNRVNLEISSGIKDYDESIMTRVPDLAGMAWEKGVQEIVDARLYIYKTASEYSEEVPKGQIISQDIKAGTEVNEGSRIGVVVSLGIQTTRVPDVQYKAKAEAEKLISEAGLKIEIKYEDNSSVAKDHVIRQSIEAGTEVEMMTTVTVWLSRGNAAVENQEDAEANEGPEKDTTEEKKDTQTTSGQNKTEETNTTQGSNNNIVIVPDVVGKTEAQAKSTLSNAGLVAYVDYVSDEGSESGIVLHQVNAGFEVSKGTSIFLTVCNNAKNVEYRHKITSYVETTERLSYGTEISSRCEYSDWGPWIEGVTLDVAMAAWTDNVDIDMVQDTNTGLYNYRTRTETWYYTYQIVDYTDWKTEKPVAGSGDTNVTYELETRETYVYRSWR